MKPRKRWPNPQSQLRNRGRHALRGVPFFVGRRRHRPTLFFSVPSNYVKLLAHCADEGRDFDLSSARHAISAGEALPAVVFHQFKERFGIEILDAIGSTEGLHMLISNRPGEVRPGSSGKVIAGFKAKIVDDEDVAVPPQYRLRDSFGSS